MGDERWESFRQALENMLLDCVESELGRAVSPSDADKLRSIITDEDVQKVIDQDKS